MKEDARGKLARRTGILAIACTFALTGQQSIGQSPVVPGSKSAFDVASVKASAGSDADMKLSTTPGRFAAKSVPLRLLILMAYHIRDFQIAGAPAWVDSSRYDIDARTESDRDLQRFQPMLQALLAERFKLAVHSETRELPVYAMQIAKKGLRLPQAKEGNCLVPGARRSSDSTSDASGQRPSCGGFIMRRGHLIGGRVSLSLLAYTLSNILGQPVIDKTGLGGNFDVDLKWTPDESQPQLGSQPPGASPPPETDAPSLFTAFQEQLGVRIESEKGPVEVLVVDHVERLSEN